MSSHREAPEISKDPVADSTDLYAFVSPDRPDTRHADRQLHPAAGARRRPELLRVRRRRALRDPRSTTTATPRPTSPTSSEFTTEGRATRRRSSTTPGRSRRSATANWNRPADLLGDPDRRHGTRPGPAAARTSPCPPGNVGPRSTPELRAARRRRPCTPARRGAGLRRAARRRASTSTSASIFDLVALRPFQNLHLIPTARARPASTRCRRSTCTRIAIQVPITDAHPATATTRRPDVRATSVIGVWATASRRKSRILRRERRARYAGHGPWQQVSRLGNPLFNEVIVPMGRQGPVERARRRADDKASRSTCSTRSWPGCCRCSTPGVFPNLAALHQAAAPTWWRSC